MSRRAFDPLLVLAQALSMRSSKHFRRDILSQMASPTTYLLPSSLRSCASTAKVQEKIYQAGQLISKICTWTEPQRRLYHNPNFVEKHRYSIPFLVVGIRSSCVSIIRLHIVKPYING